MALAILLPIRASLAGREPVAVHADGASDPQMAEASPAWTELIDPRAAACDAVARLDMVDALADLDSAWARDVLHRARDQEHDPAVRAAIDAALAPSV